MMLVMTSFMFLLAKMIMRDNQKVALLLSLILVLFFSYGPFSRLIEDFHLPIGNFVIGPHKAVLITSGILFFIGAHFIIRSPKKLESITKIMNVIALSLIIISLTSIGVYELTGWRVIFDNSGKIHLNASTATSAKSVGYPNIYYIILDSYGREDLLREVYGYDNAEFVSDLQRKGFYIANNSKSNYHATYLSLASSLNLSYLDPADGFQEKKYSANHVFSFMKQNGYTTAFISSLHTDIRMSKADYHLRIGGMGDFEYKLIGLTPIPELMNTLQLSFGSYTRHRERINYAFDAVEETMKNGWKAPVFVYAHILAPHPPFVFGPNGESVQPSRPFSTEDANVFYSEGGTQEEYIKGYREQVQYINKRLLRLVNGILSRKNDFSVIILQGDHGPRSMTNLSDIKKTNLKEAYSILNAYYLPGNGNAALYESITPVNTFRLILDLYFGQSYGLLEDRSYYYNILLSPAIVDITEEADMDVSRKGSFDRD